ncbi:MFS transporter [Micromonospora sp. NPDC094482]|uniref:MFS transporter n=1 Tax=unclassified Micromonospora TaxID=2617518 RepID=UPI003332F391
MITKSQHQDRVSVWSPTFALTAASAFMVAIDNLVVVTALPVIGHAFGADIKGLQWTVSAYTLTYAVFQLASAAAGDRFGRRRVFITGLILFVVGSGVAATAPTIQLLIGARAVQGLGAAMVSPLALAIIAHATPRSRRAMVLAAWSGIVGIGIAIGPIVGGVLVDLASWHWIFLVNLPVGLVILPLIRVKIKESCGPRRRFDVLGVIFSSAAFAMLLYALINGNDLGWTHPRIVGAGLGFVALLASFVLTQARTEQPMLPLRLMGRRAFATSIVLYLLMTFGLFGALFLISQYFQNALGYTPMQAGLAMVPAATMPVLVAPLSGLVARRYGSSSALFAGLALQAIGLGWLSLAVAPGASYIRILPSLLTVGVAIGMFFGQISKVILESVPAEWEGIAAGVGTTFRQLGTTLGIAILGAAFAAHGGDHDAKTIADGLSAALWIGAGAAAVAAVLALTLPRKLAEHDLDVTAVPEELDSEAASKHVIQRQGGGRRWPINTTTQRRWW